MGNKKVILLNASNMDTIPVYPYAFIQVTAIARQVGIGVICKDLFGIPQERWKQTIQSLIDQHNPVMILVTLRNTDSLTSQDYEQAGIKETGKTSYFPIEQTRELIATIRSISNLKIVMGGFSFSLLPNELMHYLHPDFGVVGGPNGFFVHFDEIQNGNFEKVPNLLYFQGEQLISNPRKFYPPHADTEYTQQAIEEMMAFYEALPSAEFMGAAIEIMRGCPHSCVFCAEPHVVGRQVRYRDISAVMGDIEILADHGITQFHMISSELNPEGNTYLLQLADKIRSFNDHQKEDRKVKWNGANYLLKFSFDEYKRLYQSGFTGGWFDITALDDDNARAMQTPYRNKSLLSHLKTYAQAERFQLDQLLKEATYQADPQEGKDAIHKNDKEIEWTMFLGNPATTIKTIRNNLQVTNQEGLPQLFGSCHINTNIRVFDYEKPDEATLNVTYSITPELERTSYQQIFPSFAYPPALLQHFGSEEKVAQMFDHIADTYLSTKYLKTRDWLNFLIQKTTAASITTWVEKLSKMKKIQLPNQIGPTINGEESPVIQRLFSRKFSEEEIYIFQDLAIQVVESLLNACLEMFPDPFRTLGFPTTMDKLEQITPYDLTVTVFSRWSTEEELINELSRHANSELSSMMQDFIQFGMQAILYRSNVLIRPDYRELFVSVELSK